MSAGTFPRYTIMWRDVSKSPVTLFPWVIVKELDNVNLQVVGRYRTRPSAEYDLARYHN